MKSSDNFISPIALDLGAKKTGVYSACYPANISVKEFANKDKVFKQAFVADIALQSEGGYKLLQVERTSKRHSLRCRTRKQQAKRLLNLVLKNVYQFPVEKHQIAISHFMNRRGYNYLDAQLDLLGIENITQIQLNSFFALLNEQEAVVFSSVLNEQDLLLDLQKLVNEEPNTLLQLQRLFTTTALDKPLKKDLKPLIDAVNTYAADISKGAKHRSKYFKAIHNDINNLRNHPERSCRRLFHALNEHKGFARNEFIQVFYTLLCHINNFELKPLNAILNALTESATITKIETEIAKVFCNWITKQWMLSPANGQQRLAEIKVLQNNWKTFYRDFPNQCLAFLLKTPVTATIAPYQSQTNRRPPSCQTLTLNAKYLSTTYKHWRTWLLAISQVTEQYSELNEYQLQLSKIQNKKGNALIPSDELNARTLQRILDASQNSDPNKLNAIWGVLKKLKELARKPEMHGQKKWQLELQQFIEASQLPDTLKQQLSSEGHYEESSFWHCLNQYYQIRRRAKEGRYFLHHDVTVNSKKQRWQSEGKLLTLCSHRPKQLKHQALQDIMVLFGLSETALCEHWKITAEQLTLDVFTEKFNAIRGLKSNAEKALQAQKKFGIDLKSQLHSDKDLTRLVDTLTKLSMEMAKLLCPEAQRDKFILRNQSIFQFAQLAQLLWGERSGFAKTCPVCSADNAARMQIRNENAQASRLTTMSFRLIDGGLKRLLTHQAHHIANRVWPQLELQLAKVAKLTIPLILEQNRFDFTANLIDVKGAERKNSGKLNKIDLNLPATQKHQRIKAASAGQCPYVASQQIQDENGQIDHIIPRTSTYGVLNDEANLIYCSTKGNQTKNNATYSLENLSPAYLLAQFSSSDSQAITQQIENALYNPEKSGFIFGQYRQFIALTQLQQIAFRHALFLADEHPLKQMVIQAIQHRSKAKVNGVQRYMAQLLADIITQKAKLIGAESKLEFDYFEVSSNPQDEYSTVALRKLLSDLLQNTPWDITPFTKLQGQSQKDYSHVIDATLAMMITAQAHQNEGALKIQFAEQHSIWGAIDTTTGELVDNLSQQFFVHPESLAESVIVKPQSSNVKIEALANENISINQVFSRTIFKETLLGLKFYHLTELDGKLYKGFIDVVDGQCQFYKASKTGITKEQVQLNAMLANGLYRQKEFSNMQVYMPNKTALTESLFNALSQAKQQLDKQSADFKVASWLFGKAAGSLYYYTNNSDLINAPKYAGSKDESPYKNRWQAFLLGWQQALGQAPKIDKQQLIIAADQHEKWQHHCEAFLNKKNAQKQHCPKKGYSMEALQSASGALALVKRKNKDKTIIYQVLVFDNSVVAKGQEAAIALKSPNLVCLNSDVLKQGYQVNNADVTGKQIDPEKLIHTEILNQLNANPLGVKVESNSRISVSGISISWVQDNLLNLLNDEPFKWQGSQNLYLDSSDKEETKIVAETLKGMFKVGLKLDKSKPIKITKQGEAVTLTLPVVKSNIEKLLV